MDWSQLHLALNHVPVIGIPVLLLLFIWGSVRAQPVLTRTALWWLAILSALAIAIKFTGDFAAEEELTRLAGLQGLVSRHEQHADQATTGVFLLLLACGVALWFGRRQAEPLWARWLVIVLGVATCLLFMRTAHSGGGIGHPELRPPNGTSTNAVAPITSGRTLVVESRRCRVREHEDFLWFGQPPLRVRETTPSA
jgi:hypothetical protein